MNPKNTQKKGKFACACCLKREEFDSNEVIFDYFGKEFSEYEYVIENLAIRPAPKKLLDLVPVHSTNISQKSIYKTPVIENSHTEILHEPTAMEYRHKAVPTEQGDFQKPDPPPLKLLQKTDDFISLKILPDEAEPRKCGPCNPASANYNPCSNYPYDNKPCGTCRIQTFPEKCKPLDFDIVPDVLDLRRTIKSKEYRTTKQILSDLCKASEQSLQIKPKNTKITPVPIPTEIKDTIQTLKFKKPLPQFFTRTEKKLFHKPGVYFADVTQETASDEDNTNTDETEEQRFNDVPEQEARLSGQQRLSGQSALQRLDNQSGQHRSSNQSGQQRLSNQSGQQRLSNQSGQQRLSTQFGQKRLSNQFDQQRSNQQRLSNQSDPAKLSNQLGQGRLSNQSRRSTDRNDRRISEPIGFQSELQPQESNITIDDLSEHVYEQNATKQPDHSSYHSAMDSTVQTDVSKKCPCPKKSKKNLKWKIIINKHSNCKC